MKRTYRYVAMLVVTIIATFTFVACGDEEQDNNQVANRTEKAIGGADFPYWFNGTWPPDYSCRTEKSGNCGYVDIPGIATANVVEAIDNDETVGYFAGHRNELLHYFAKELVDGVISGEFFAKANYETLEQVGISFIDASDNTIVAAYSIKP